MAATIDDKPKVKLGPLFWILWLAAVVAVMAAFFALMFWNMAQEEWSSLIGTAGVMAFTIAIWVLAMTPYLIRRKKGAETRMRPPIRRYLMRFMPAMMVYVAIMMPATELYQESDPTGALAWAIAIAPSIPLLFAIRAIMLYLKEEDDEFQRAMAVQAHVMATGLMMAICTVYGFLDLFGLVPHVQAWAVVPLWAVCLVPAQVAARWRFR